MISCPEKNAATNLSVQSSEFILFEVTSYNMRIGTRRETVDKNIIVFRKPVDEVRLGKSLFRLDITRMEL